jgi:predicted transcriptional regulator
LTDTPQPRPEPFIAARAVRRVKELAEEIPVSEYRLPEPAVREEERKTAEQTLGGRPVTEEEYQRYLDWLEDADWNIRVNYRVVYES